MTDFEKKAITAGNLATLTGAMTSTLIVLVPTNLEVVDTLGNRVGTIDIVNEKYTTLYKPTSIN